MDSIIRNDFKVMHQHLIQLNSELNAHSTSTQIDDIANNLIYNNIDNMIGQLRYDPANTELWHQLYRVSKRFQMKIKLDFGFGDVSSNELTKANAYRDRAWIIYEGTNHEQGLTANVLSKYITTMDNYVVKVINNGGLVK